MFDTINFGTMQHVKWLLVPNFIENFCRSYRAEVRLALTWGPPQNDQFSSFSLRNDLEQDRSVEAWFTRWSPIKCSGPCPNPNQKMSNLYFQPLSRIEYFWSKQFHFQNFHLAHGHLIKNKLLFFSLGIPKVWLISHTSFFNNCWNFSLWNWFFCLLPIFWFGSGRFFSIIWHAITFSLFR